MTILIDETESKEEREQVSLLNLEQFKVTFVTDEYSRDFLNDLTRKENIRCKTFYSRYCAGHPIREQTVRKQDSQTNYSEE